MERESTQRFRFWGPFQRQEQFVVVERRKGGAPSASDVGGPFEKHKQIFDVVVGKETENTQRFRFTGSFLRKKMKENI